MSQSSGPRAHGNESAATAASESALALGLAMSAWSHGRDRAATGPPGDAIERFSTWLNPAWTERLRALGERAGAGSDAQGSLARLRTMHAQSARIDLSRVHSSWLARALKEESPAVQRAVAANLSPSMRTVMQSELLLDSADLTTERAPRRKCSAGSWRFDERLVGSEHERSDDAPVLSAVTGLSPRSGYRLCRLMGLAKRVLAEGGSRDDSSRSLASRNRTRWFSARLAGAEVELTALAAKDVRAAAAVDVPHRHVNAHIGLTTIARLLADTEPVPLQLGTPTLAVPPCQGRPVADRPNAAPAPLAFARRIVNLASGAGTPRIGKQTDQTAIKRTGD